MGNDEGNANKESPSVALVVPLDTAVEGQAHMELEKEQVPESGEVGKVSFCCRWSHPTVVVGDSSKSVVVRSIGVDR